MNKELRLKAMAVPAIAAFGLTLAAVPASASWISAFNGTSIFDSPCPLCDSSNDFAVWRNDGQSGNWATDLGLTNGMAPQLVNGTDRLVGGDPNTWSGGVDTGAQFVFFYQTFNTNPGGVANNPLENFNVSVENKGETTFSDLSAVLNPFTSGGYVPGKNLYATTAPNLDPQPNGDTPFDWEPSLANEAPRDADPTLPDGGGERSRRDQLSSVGQSIGFGWCCVPKQ